MRARMHLKCANPYTQSGGGIQRWVGLHGRREREWELWSAATPYFSNSTPRALLTALAGVTRGVLVASGATNYACAAGWVGGSGWGGDLRP